MLRALACVSTAFALLSCAGGSGAEVSIVMPQATRQALTGFDANGRAIIALEVVCDDGRGGRYERELSAQVERVAFFVPPCGQATLGLTISGVYDDQDPVEAFNAQASAFLEGGKNADVEFVGLAYGELVLDARGEPITFCTAQDTGLLYEPITIDMSLGAPVTQRVPAANYDIYCYDALSAFANYQPTRVGAGQRTGPDLSLPPPVVNTSDPPVVRDLNFYSIKPDGVFMTWGFTTSSLTTISFTVTVGYDAQLTELAFPPVTTQQARLDIQQRLTPQTHYYVRVTATDEYGTSNALTGELDTIPESFSSRLVNVLINNVPLQDFDPARQGYSYFASSLDASVTVVATTEDPNAYVRVNSELEVTHSATAEVPIPPGQSHIYIYVRTFDGSSSRSYDIVVTKP